MSTVPEPLRVPGFRQFWWAKSISAFGTSITLLALPVFVVTVLGGTATDVGLLNATRWLPYLLLGLIVGALVDRVRRKPLLVATDLARGVVLAVLPLSWLLGWLSFPLLLGVVGLVGVMSLINDSASQSILPRLVPRSALLGANARLDQTMTTATTSGPAISGGLIGLIGAPLTIAVDTITYLFSGLLTARIRLDEPEPAPQQRQAGRLRREIAEGLAWTYRHRTLAPHAISTHAWFICNAAMNTALVPFALVQLGIGPFAVGLVLAIAGIGGIVGSLLSKPLAERLGVGRASVVSRLLTPLAAVIMAFAPDGQPVLAAVVLGIGQFCYGLEFVGNASEMAYRQAVTPDALQSRMNTTIRSINRAMIVVGAPLGGLLADAISARPVLLISAAGFLAGTVYLALSPFRNASLDDAEPNGDGSAVGSPPR